MRLSASTQTCVSACVFYCVLVVFVPSSVYIRTATQICASGARLNSVLSLSLSADEVFVEVITPYGSLVLEA